jgi:glycosyl transferase cpsJ(V)
MAEVSIIIPIYKAEKYINRCIESIVNQSYDGWQLILVDDGSPDKSLEICQDWTKWDSRILVISQENSGAHMARLRGFQESKTPYITFVDADDTLPATALEILHDEIIKGYDIVKGGDALHNNHVNADERIELNSKQFVEGIYVNDITPFLWGTLYKRTLFDEYIFDICVKNHLVIGEDWITNLYVGKRINKALIIDAPVYNYYTNEDSIMHTFTMSEEYAYRIGEIEKRIIGDDSQWDYMKLLKKATCISNFFYLSRSFSLEVYQAFKTFVNIYGIESLYRYVPKRFLWFSKYEFLYRIYSWCYRNMKGVVKKKKKMIK